MTNELKQVINKINKELLIYLFMDKDFESLYIVGSMIKEDYIESMYNDYDIRVIFKELNIDKIDKFENYLESICKKISNDNLEVTCSLLDGPIHHIKNNNKKNLLIHTIIYTKESLNKLSLLNKYQYGNNYKLIYGTDYFKEFKNIKYSLEDILYSYEGLYYCIDMLKRKEIRYKTWDNINNKCKLTYHISSMAEDMIISSCFYAVNTFIDNLINYCEFNNYDIPFNKMIFCIRLLGQRNINEKMLFLLHGLITKSESFLKTIFSNPLEETINLLEILSNTIFKLDEKFPKKEDKRTKIIKKYQNYILRI